MKTRKLFYFADIYIKMMVKTMTPNNGSVVFIRIFKNAVTHPTFIVCSKTFIFTRFETSFLLQIISNEFAVSFSRYNNPADI